MADIVKKSEIAAAHDWRRERFGLPLTGHFPVSFRYGGQPSASLLPGWSVHSEETRPVDGAHLETLVFVDPSTTLECRCVVKTFADFPAVEWVAWFKNIGTADTDILAEIAPLDVLLAVDAASPCQVHHARGGLSQHDDFAPLTTPLTFRQGGSRLDLSARTGKSSTLHLPFFNLQLGNSGVLGAIGWSAGWTAAFERRRDGVRVRAGMERTHLKLHAGEEIRTPRILLLFWDGAADAPLPDWTDRIRSHNLFRRLLLAHYVPRSQKQIVQPPFGDGVWGAQPEAKHLEKIRWLSENQIPTECYWIDAGWYGERPIVEAADSLGSGWMREVGSWVANQQGYPHGFGPIGDAVRTAGLGFLLWVEPERAFEGSRMVREHPEWLIGPVPSGHTNGLNYMVNLGIPAARRHITELLSNLIDAGGITCYRQDFNDLRVPELFAMADAPDRIGMSEIGHVTGLYAFWDDLLARHPGLVIDNCAGGGQRIDLETIMRSVVLWRSDRQCWPFDPMVMQTQTQGLAPWVPLTAAVCDEPTVYAMRSALGPGMVTHWSLQALDGHSDLPVATIRQLMAEAHALRKYFYGDFYPLLTYSLACDVWAAWQYDRPDLGEGMVVAFRRHESPFPRWEATLQALEPDAEYELYSWDERHARRMSGRALLTDGFTVAIDEKPGTALFTYQRVA